MADNRQIWNELFLQVEEVFKQMMEQTPVAVDHPIYGRTCAGTVDAIIIHRGEFNALETVAKVEVGEIGKNCVHRTKPQFVKEL